MAGGHFLRDGQPQNRKRDDQPQRLAERGFEGDDYFRDFRAVTCRSKLVRRSCCACSWARRSVTSRPMAMMPRTWPAVLPYDGCRNSTAMILPSFVSARLVCCNSVSFVKRPCCTAR